MNKLIKTLKKRNAFTLIELIVVIAILGVIAAVAIPRVVGSADDANEVAIEATQKTLQTAVELYKAENDVYPSTIAELVDANYIDEEPDYEKLGVTFEIGDDGRVTYSETDE